LAVSPQGQTQRITYQILSDKKDVLFTSTLPTDKISASPLPTGAYFWRAKAGYGSSESDYSALDSFQVSEPFLEISRPGDSAVWYQDSSYVVTWNTNIDVPVIIELVRDDVRVALIKDNVPGLQGGFLWKVPVSVAVGTGYAVRITPMDATSDALTTTTPFSIEVRGVPSSVTENNIRQHLTIGPNPATSDLFIGGHLLISRLMIFDSKGLLVLDRQVQGTGDVIDITPLPQGMYVLRCETHLGIVNTPIVVRR
jgi:hypothetical protein